MDTIKDLHHTEYNVEVIFVSWQWCQVSFKVSDATYNYLSIKVKDQEKELEEQSIDLKDSDLYRNC